MAWLNYHHLLYFWTVARTGSIAAAGEELHVSQPTISAQIKMLEESLGQDLFERRGRGMVLTDAGRMVFRYADEIFRLGRELQLAVEGRGVVGQRLRFAVGLVDVVPKLIAERILQPAFDSVPGVTLECREGSLPKLLGALALHELDVVISDAPAAQDARVRAFNHPLGETGTTFFAVGTLTRLKDGFPKSLNGAPALLPSRSSQVRRQLDDWFAREDLRPDVVGEFDDSALLKVFGQRGLGFFVAPTAIERHVIRQYEAEPIGRLPEIRDRFFAISVERKLRHPAVTAIAEAARSELFAPESSS